MESTKLGNHGQTVTDYYDVDSKWIHDSRENPRDKTWEGRVYFAPISRFFPAILSPSYHSWRMIVNRAEVSVEEAQEMKRVLGPPSLTLGESAIEKEVERMRQTGVLKDSGDHEEFESGSRRDQRDGKGRGDLRSPIVDYRLDRHYENGAEKYEDRNWEKGQPLMRYWESADRHMRMYKEGYRDEDHLAAAIWNLSALMHTEEMIRRGLLPEELDNTPCYLTPEQMVEQFSGLKRWHPAFTEGATNESA